jgi:hypothetical protein
MTQKTNYKLLAVLFVLSACFTVTSSEAQIWKRLKNKAKEKIKKTEDKLIDKLDKKTDKVLDSTIDGTGKKNAQNDRGKSFGSASINHSALYGMFSVSEVTRTKVNKEGNKVSISGSWRTSDADIFDGYILNIKTVNSIDELQNKTFKIPEEATLELGYNALVQGTYVYERGKEHAPQILQVTSGSATVTFNKDKDVNIMFTANVKLRDHKVEKGMTHNTPATINGSIRTSEPIYSITQGQKTVQSNSNTNSNLTNEETAALKNKLSPTINLPNSYSFSQKIKVEITDDRGDAHPVEFLFGAYPDIYGMSVASKELQGQGDVTMVMTPKSSTMFMNVAGMKMKRTSSMDQMGQFNVSENMPSSSDFTYKKTGKTKTILGYQCEEYQVDYTYTDATGSVSFWVSKDFPIQNKELPMLGMKMNNPYFDGFVLELSSVHQGKSIQMKVTEVSNTSLTIRPSEYKNAGF